MKGFADITKNNVRNKAGQRAVSKNGAGLYLWAFHRLEAGWKIFIGQIPINDKIYKCYHI
jgi:hypothetical protein